MGTEFWRGTRVLITGGSGFVGAHLARRLVDLGAWVRGIDPAGDTSPCLRAHGLNKQFVVAHPGQGGLGSLGLRMFYEDSLLEPPDVIFHLAGVSHIAYAQQHPQEAWDTNVRTTWAILEACRDLPELKAVVVASSNHTIGPQATWPATEDAPLNQRDVYGASKICADVITQCYGQTLGVPTVALRHVNCYGPADPHASHLVTHCLLACLRGEAPVLRNRGTARKSYLHVSDVVDAYLILAEQGPAVAGRSFWAADAPVSVWDVAAMAMRVAGIRGDPVVMETDLDQVDYYESLDSTRLRALGWVPKIPLAEGLHQTLNWYREHDGMAWLDR